jgi:iron complex outermembrane receptor protein
MTAITSVAENEVSYVLEQSINPSLGILSPTTFNPGVLTQEESGINADFVKTFDGSPLNLGFGFEWRNETYVIDAGDQGSIQVGPTFAQFGLGSDGFQGFSPESAGSFEKDSYAAYVDMETDFNDQFSGALAVRFEDHDDFSSTTDWKISGRYEISDTFAVRATANTGFRVPTPGQVHTLNVTTTSDTDGNLIPSGTYPVGHPVAVALGSVPLISEESQSFTIGMVLEPLDNTIITLDFYSIDVEDRISLVGKIVDQQAVDNLVSAGFPNAELLLGSSASYFTNGFDSDISGMDLVISTVFEVGNGMLNVDVRHNYNDQEVKNVKAGAINGDRVYDLENQVPQNSSVLTFDYSADKFSGLVRINFYGDWETTGGLFGAGDASDAVSYNSDALVDVEARYRFSDRFTVAIGGENIFDTYPNGEQNGVLDFLGVQHALTSPWGFNGGFWYARFTAEF